MAEFIIFVAQILQKQTMKNLFYTTLAFSLLLLSYFNLEIETKQNIQEAKIPIIYSSGEALTEVKTLPKDAVFDDGTHFNLGVYHNQFSIFYMPIWNYGNPQYALINDKKDQYIVLDQEDVKEVSKEYNLQLSETPSLPWTTKIGGKPIIILILLFSLRGFIFKR